MDANGNFVISWTSNGQDSSLDGVFAQRFNSAGAGIEEGEFQVNTYTSSAQTSSTVAMNGTGFVIAWAKL